MKAPFLGRYRKRILPFAESGLWFLYLLVVVFFGGGHILHWQLPQSEPNAWPSVSLQIQQLLLGNALVYALPLHVANHFCHCPVQAISKLRALQVSYFTLVSSTWS